MNFIIYPSHFELMEQLTDEQSGKLIKAIGQYNKDIYPEIDDQLVKGIFISIKRDFDIQAENYQKIVERNRANSKKAGAKVGNQNARKHFDTIQNNPLDTNGNENNPNNLKDKDKDKDKDIVVSTGSILENRLRRQENLSEYLDDYFNS